MEQDKEDKDYEEKYDPVGYKSELTIFGRGPLGKDWMEVSSNRSLPLPACNSVVTS